MTAILNIFIIFS